MGPRNVMPTLPNQPNQRPQRNKPSKQGGGKGVNIKALIVVVVVIIGIIVLLIVKGNESNKYESKPESSASEVSESEESSDVSTAPPEPVEKDPAENSGTQLVDILAEGSVFKTDNKYILASDIAYPGAISVADSTVISMDKNLTLSPSASCAYTYEFNTANITHSSGALLTLTRRQAVDRRKMPTIEDYTASLEEIAVANGIIDPAYGEVYVGTSRCGIYAKGKLKANKTETDKTILVMHFSGDPEIYSISAIYSSQDELDLLFNSVKLYGTSLKLN